MSDNNGNASAVPGRPEMPSVIVPKSASEALRPEAGTPPPRRSRRARNQFVVFLNFVLSVVIFLTLAGGAAIYFGARQFEDPGPLKTADTVLVRPSTSVADIASQLERLNMVSDARIFRLGVRAFGHDDTLKAGEYEIRAGASMRDIMELMQSGKSVQYSLTIPEGMTVWQAFKRIAATEELSGDLPAELPPEGSLAADTLRFTRGMERKAIVDKLIADQRALVESIWARRDPDLPINTIDEFVTLASIVEKETGRADERPHVASVFVNRLRRGMRLQSDPTILYGLFGGQGKPEGRPIYRSDIDKPTPYNTYTIDGLPPGPIANPGRAALEAVANPSETKDLYFVADGTGGHVFAETLDEHNANVARYRAFLKQQEEAAAAGD
ncbi:MAG: endolytic transglycosylase MltG [Rhizobiaceae bacterium]|nr:endolytic transglycosylase MltG [Rhizobiaceae bacterium]